MELGLNGPEIEMAQTFSRTRSLLYTEYFCILQSAVFLLHACYTLLHCTCLQVISKVQKNISKLNVEQFFELYQAFLIWPTWVSAYVRKYVYVYYAC